MATDDGGARDADHDLDSTAYIRAAGDGVSAGGNIFSSGNGTSVGSFGCGGITSACDTGNNGETEETDKSFVNYCTLQNDTQYEVEIIDFDGNRTLKPGDSQGNWLIIGFNIKLVIKFPGSEEEKITFPASEYKNLTHKMSELFQDQISKYESSRETGKLNDTIQN